MFKLLGKIPRKVNLAFSGGVDSLAVAKFLGNNHEVTLYHFNHGCQYSDEIENQCRQRSIDLGLDIIVGRCDTKKPDGQSLEDFWRRSRYRWLRSYGERFVTCHHLNDAVEQWLFSAINGNPNIIPYQDELVYRPFLLTSKEQLINYAIRHNLTPVEDEYNHDQSKMRNYIRKNLIDHVYHINPGIEKVIRKKYLDLKTKAV